ncbi:MAG: aminotransferase class I/II-fold pyridoxal phosphate-dependent enzyme, partial [Oscillospiraceae bacterium]|nr:aminotransferase class I/II-fold pyridoxal phosphate-dependent enzyme [Oscillospiraceae bacterium]
ASAFGAENAFFIVGGTTAAVQTAIFAALRPGEKIILPRNVHISALNALVLNGGIPAYVSPDIDKELGFPLGITLSALEKAMNENPDARAVFINNPTYYGVCSDISRLTKAAHSRQLSVIADEAHGTHLYFGSDMPISGIAAGADITAVSMHKSGGSLTQSSMLLSGSGFPEYKLRQFINLTQTTSANYLLLSSLDISRRNLALRGAETFAKVQALARYAREEINTVGGYYAYGAERADQTAGSAFYAFDDTKLVINVSGLGLSGMETYDILRDEFNIQAEFGDMHNILAYLSVGDRERDIDRLISALSEIKRLYARPVNRAEIFDYIAPIVAMTPSAAFYSPKESIKLSDTVGRVSGEFVNVYPPGIPCLAPGELITAEVVDYIRSAKASGGFITGTKDKDVNCITVVR